MDEQGEDEMSDSDSSEEEEQEAATEKDPMPAHGFKYDIDPFLVRREASLLTLIRRGFYKRVIVFFNEKK
jgi:hypothetical protein